MFISETKIRVRYGETDQMGVVYHGNYALYFEIGRTESLRQLNVTYKELEAGGVMMPVMSLKTEYKKPALYDDLLTVRTIFRSLPTVKSHIFYEVLNEAGVLICTGETVLAFVDMKTRRITRCPEFLLNVFKPFFEE